MKQEQRKKPAPIVVGLVAGSSAHGTFLGTIGNESTYPGPVKSYLLAALSVEIFYSAD